MNFIRRIGYDAGATPLEDALAAAAQHDFHYLDFSADTGPNRLDNWPDDRIRAVRATMERHRIALTVHTASSVNVAEYAPGVGPVVDACLRANIDLARRIAAPSVVVPSVVIPSVVVHAGMRFSAAGAERMAAARDRLLRAVAYAETGSVSRFFENLNRAPDAAEVHCQGHTR